jgi:Mg/Co/Ni transporter MgtE
MNQSTTEIASGTVRDIEPELRELFTKIVERDPHEAVKMLEPYPDEFVVKMLELLNPAAALKILQRFHSSRRETILATASSETTQQWMRNQTYPERTVGRLMQPPLAVFSTDNDRRRHNRANSAAREKNDYHLRVCDG